MHMRINAQVFCCLHHMALKVTPNCLMRLFRPAKAVDATRFGLQIELFPDRSEASPANPDLPPDIRRDYGEAGSILHRSPRGAAALLRLCIQKLCRHLGQNGRTIDDDIGSIVENGLDSRVQKALDIVRVIGNSPVHPGKMDISDNAQTATHLFGLVNLIADAISQPKHVDDLFDKLPESAKQAIAKRDAKASPPRSDVPPDAKRPAESILEGLVGQSRISHRPS
jgi:hypothetical protein